MKRKPKTYTDRGTGIRIIVGPPSKASAKRLRETAKRAAESLKRLAKK